MIWPATSDTMPLHKLYTGTLTEKPILLANVNSPGTPPPGQLNTIGVAKYSDFGPIDGYISETVQDRR